jgi:hypothetical protein
MTLYCRERSLKREKESVKAKEALNFFFFRTKIHVNCSVIESIKP